MLEKVYSKRPLQLLLGLAIGFCFGFLLQKGGVTRYDVIMGQLLLQDWTVVKVILTAILTGMIGIYLLRIPGSGKIAHLVRVVRVDGNRRAYFWRRFCDFGLLPGNTGRRGGTRVVGCLDRWRAGDGYRSRNLRRHLSQTCRPRSQVGGIRQGDDFAGFRCEALAGDCCGHPGDFGDFRHSGGGSRSDLIIKKVR